MSAPKKVLAKIINLQRYENNITLLTLETKENCRFRPGQFLHLTPFEYDRSRNWPESRVFSIANSPKNEKILKLLISPKGLFTTELVNHLSIGKSYWVKLPYGVFDFNKMDGDIVLIAGGTGISPFMSFLEDQLLGTATKNRIELFYGVRKTSLIIIDDLINKCKKSLPMFSSEIFVEDYEGEDDKHFSKGILPLRKIINTTTILNNPLYYLSGPKGMITDTGKILKEFCVSSERVFFDNWE